MARRSRAVLLTGCSTGIGRATAARLLRAGLTVYATARNVESIADLRALGAPTMPLDVTDEESMRSAVERVEQEAGAVGVLVNNAGYSQSGAIETVPMADLRRQFETNVFGLVRMCQLVLPGMRERRWGRIVNLSSMGGRLTFPGAGVYHGTKHAVEAISDALRFEVAGFGVKVVVVEPGLIRTEFGATASRSVRPADGPYSAFNAGVAETTRDVYSRGPFARLGGEPEDVAAVIERAVLRRNPPTRVRVTASADLFLTTRRLLPDRAWDRVLATTYRAPAPDERT